MDYQRLMRRQALVPVDVSAKMPGVYRLWRLCKDNNTLWWDGGISNQPHILMMEFEVCERSWREFEDYIGNIRAIISKAK